MKKLVLTIGLVIASVVNIFGQSEILSESFKEFEQSKNYNECIFMKRTANDDNTEFFKIGTKFLTDSLVRMKFANDPIIGRLRAGYSAEKREFLLFRDLIKNTNWNFDSTYTKLNEAEIFPEWGQAVIYVIVTDKNKNTVISITMFFNFTPTTKKSVDINKLRMNLSSLQVYIK
jgi:hypothetical protein